MREFNIGLLVFAGGGFGSVIRWAVSIMSLRLFSSTWQGTLFVNVIGSLAFYILFKGTTNFSPYVQGLLRVGLLGGLTTFSTFSFEIFSYVRTGNYGVAATIFLLNVICGIVIGILVFR